MEQNNGEIFTQGLRATSALEKLSVWQNGSAVFFIHAPDGMASVSIVIGTTVTEAAYDTTKRCWRVYCQPLLFATPGSFCYTIKAIDEYGNSAVLGKGTLVVVESPVAEGDDGGSILPSEAYAFNPLTKQYHRLTAEQDPETGEIVVSVEQTGVTK